MFSFSHRMISFYVHKILFIYPITRSNYKLFFITFELIKRNEWREHHDDLV